MDSDFVLDTTVTNLVAASLTDVIDVHNLKKLIFVRKQIFRAGKCPQNGILSKQIKVSKIAFFLFHGISSNQKYIYCGLK